MSNHLTVNRRQLYIEFALLMIFFVIPIFAFIGKGDVENDEAVHSFASDQILRDGDWLTPKGIYDGKSPFFEKPPLKFWLVAAGIKLGLPNTNFGHRFFDAIFASFTLVYILLLGNRMAGPWAGLASVLVFFGIKHLLFAHCLLNNNMESCLLLQCTGSVFHFNAWANGQGRTRWHVLALFIFFVLAFLTKFVAALLLPASLFVIMFVHSELWHRLARDWAIWIVGFCVTVFLIAPWFIYQHLSMGDSFWHVIFGQHVYQRMTHGLDPGHINPWFYYATYIWGICEQSPGPVAIAAVIYFVATRWQAKTILDSLISAWFIVPVVLISAMKSKLGHYVYPFLPPLAIVTGAFIVRTWIFHAPAWTLKNAIRWAFVTAMVVSVLIGLWTAYSGKAILAIGETVIFRNSSIFRPLAIGAILGACAVLPRRLPLLLALCMPLAAYSNVIEKMSTRSQNFTILQSCLSEFENGSKVRAYFNPATSVNHILPFYHRLVEYTDWNAEHAEAVLFGEKPRMVLLSQPQYRALRVCLDSRQLSLLTAHLMPPALLYTGPDRTQYEVPVLLLPKPFNKCDELLRRSGSKPLEQ